MAVAVGAEEAGSSAVWIRPRMSNAAAYLLVTNKDEYAAASLASSHTKSARPRTTKFQKKQVSFFVELRVSEEGNGALLGEHTRIEVEVTHTEDDEEEELVTWTDQFRQVGACIASSRCRGGAAGRVQGVVLVLAGARARGPGGSDSEIRRLC